MAENENGGRSIYGPATKVCQASSTKRSLRRSIPPSTDALNDRKSRKNYARHVNRSMLFLALIPPIFRLNDGTRAAASHKSGFNLN
jgi:hypothetical protein